MSQSLAPDTHLTETTDKETIIMEFSEMYSREPFFFFRASDTSKFNKNERAALEALQVAASQLQVLHEYPVMQIGVTFDSSFQLPFTAGNGLTSLEEVSEEVKTALTLTKGPYTRLTIPPLASSRLMPIEYRRTVNSSDVSFEYATLVSSVWALATVFLAHMEEEYLDLQAHRERLRDGLYEVAEQVIRNVMATLKTIEPPAPDVQGTDAA